MPDTSVTVNAGENSPEQVAFKLMQIVAATEAKVLQTSGYQKADADRKWLLDTYAECLQAAKGFRSIPKV